MKTISRRRSSSEKRLLSILAVGVLFVVFVFSPLRLLGGTLEFISWPLRALGALAPNSMRTYFIGMETMRTEREMLQNSLTQREEELSILRGSVTDYEALYNLREQAPESAIMSAVMLTPSQSPYDSLVIDRGEKDGVKIGAIVYANEGRPIGTVTRTLVRSAVVALFSSPGVETNVFVRGADVHAKATGLGGGSLSVLLAHGSKVEEGDAVLMPSLSPSVIGIVEWIDTDPAAPGIIVTVSQEDTLSSLRFVAVDSEPRAVPTLKEIQDNLTQASTTISGFFLPLSELASTTATTTTATSSGTTTNGVEGL